MKRITLLLGHYGSGKTNIAANLALMLRRAGYSVCVADLDIVNPYFRTADWSEEFSAAGISLVTPRFANTNLDIPALPSEVYGLLQQREKRIVMDIGGDDSGAVAVGQYAKRILEENDYEALYVVNFLRPLTRTPADALMNLREIETITGIPFTGIVNNPNLGGETTLSLIDEGARLSRELSLLASVPLLYTAVDDKIVKAELSDKDKYGIDGVFYINTKRFF